ncbi:hypothetical protein N8I77_002974 [Diaporthe amygdali]|uniref:Protein kinase domain-containing protein n=1 Tax=Phomopsis amygdali TaxID=1214568 RepID=A0AAD9SKD8_PHOAM|nr:hypothetical protein N8I77_002974 [Diaporthe amygdali]
MARYLPVHQTNEVVMVEECPGEPRCGPHAQQYAIEPLLLTLEDKYITKEIAIINFGVACEAENSIKPSVIPDKYASPERQRELGSLLSIGSDMWVLGCTITEVLCGTNSFEVSDKLSFEQLEGTLGPMPEPLRSRFVDYCRVQHRPYRLHHPSNPHFHLLWEVRKLEERRQGAFEAYGTEDILYRILGREACGPYPDPWGEPGKRISKSLAETADSHRKQSVPSCEPINLGTVKRRLDPDALPGAVNLLRQVFRRRPEDRVAARELLDHKWFKGRSRHKTLEPERTMGPTFEDNLMEDVPLPLEISVNEDDLPPQPQPAD